MASLLVAMPLVAGCGGDEAPEPAKAKTPSPKAVYEKRASQLVQATASEFARSINAQPAAPRRARCRVSLPDAQDHDGEPDDFECELVLDTVGGGGEAVWTVDGPKASIENPNTGQVTETPVAVTRIPRDAAEAEAQYRPFINAFSPGYEDDDLLTYRCVGPDAREAAVFYCRTSVRIPGVDTRLGGLERVTFDDDGSIISRRETRRVPPLASSGSGSSCSNGIVNLGGGVTCDEAATVLQELSKEGTDGEAPAAAGTDLGGGWNCQGGRGDLRWACRNRASGARFDQTL